MSKIVAIHQPNYIPWLGYFYKISQADYFVFLDDAQFSNEGMHNYHYIKTSAGSKRLRIPVYQTLGDKINQVRIKNEIPWQNKHLALLTANYMNANNFREIHKDFENLINENCNYLFQLNISIIKYICKKLGINSEFIKSSDLKINSNKENKIIDICMALQCDVYYSGIGAKAYQNENNFINKGIQLRYSEFNSFIYTQQYDGFQPNVSIIDFLMNIGYNWDIVMDHQIAMQR